MLCCSVSLGQKKTRTLELSGRRKERVWLLFTLTINLLVSKIYLQHSFLHCFLWKSHLALPSFFHALIDAPSFPYLLFQDPTQGEPGWRAQHWRFTPSLRKTQENTAARWRPVRTTSTSERQSWHSACSVRRKADFTQTRSSEIVQKHAAV